MPFFGPVERSSQGVFTTQPKNTGTPPSCLTNTTRRRPSGLRHLQGDEYQLRRALALGGLAAHAGVARRGEDAGVALRGQAVAPVWLMLKAKAFGGFSVSVVE